MVSFIPSHGLRVVYSLKRAGSVESLHWGQGPRRTSETGAVLMPTPDTTSPSHCIRDITAEDRRQNKNGGRVVTRFPPEPNGYLHIGPAKSICLNFGLAQEFGGRCHLRFDDTNPTKEEQEYIDAIKRDLTWLRFAGGDHLYHASDYFEQLYAWAEYLISSGKAYVDDQPQDEMRATRGTLTEPGRDSPFRSRGVEENL